MKKIILTILLFCMLTLLVGCSSKENKFILGELLPENIENVEVRIYQYAEINDRELDPTAIAELKNWIEQLSLKHKTFKDGQTPGSDADGGYAYEFIINDGVLSFEYMATDVNYIWYDNEWYEITNKNISEPPIGESEVKSTFQATILEIHDGYYLVEPVEGSSERNSADRITVPMTNMNPLSEPEVGDVLEIEYDGSIAESYPAQITSVYSISVIE